MWISTEQLMSEDELNFDKFLKNIEKPKKRIQSENDEETGPRKLIKKYGEHWQNRVRYNDK
jgi:hypothetical protein